MAEELKIIVACTI